MSAFTDFLSVMRQATQQAAQPLQSENNPNRQEAPAAQTVNAYTTPTQEAAMDPLVPHQQQMPKLEKPAEDKPENQDNKEEKSEKTDKDKQRAMIMGSTLTPEDAGIISGIATEGLTPEEAINRQITANISDGGMSSVLKGYADGTALKNESSNDTGVTAEDEKAQAVQDLLNRYNGWNKLTQREQFNRTMFNDDGSLTDFGQAIVNDFGEDFGNRDNAYEEWRDSDNRDLTSRLYGYDGNQGIQGWQALAKRSGVNDLDGMMDYMWGDENVFNPLEWLQDESYAANGKLGYSDDAAAALAQYMYNNGLTLPEGVQALNGVNLSEAGNAEDFGTYALLNQMLAEGAQNNNQIDLNRYDLNRLNDILGASGEGYLLGMVDDNGEFREKENTNPRNYSMAGLLQGQVNPYVGEGNSGNLDADELDTMLALLNASYEGQGKKVGIKER